MSVFIHMDLVSTFQHPPSPPSSLQRRHRSAGRDKEPNELNPPHATVRHLIRPSRPPAALGTQHASLCSFYEEIQPAFPPLLYVNDQRTATDIKRICYFYQLSRANKRLGICNCRVCVLARDCWAWKDAKKAGGIWKNNISLNSFMACRVFFKRSRIRFFTVLWINM